MLWTKEVLEYAEVSIWGCHFKRCWLWWQRFLLLPLLIPTPVSELTISLLATISAVPPAVLSAQLWEERRELCCESRKFQNCLCPRNQHLVTPGILQVHVLYTRNLKSTVFEQEFSQDVSCAFSCFFCKGITFKMSITILQASLCHRNQMQLMPPRSVFWHKIDLFFYAFEEEMFAFCIFKSFFLSILVLPFFKNGCSRKGRRLLFTIPYSSSVYLKPTI